LQPAELEAGANWPDEDEAELDNVLDSHISHVLGKNVATYDELEWLGASDVWLTRWWPRVEKRVRQGLARSTAEDKYPLLVNGALTLASGEELNKGELLAPNLAGWQRFLELAPASGLKLGELRDAGAAYWTRKLPRGLLAAQGAAETESSSFTPSSATPSPTNHVLDPEEARMGELLRRGRDEEEAQWAVAVARGTTVEHARGLAPEAARRAAIKNLSANIHHYDAASAATDKADASPTPPARPSHFPPGMSFE
jgi:hypothetical protein